MALGRIISYTQLQKWAEHWMKDGLLPQWLERNVDLAGRVKKELAKIKRDLGKKFAFLRCKQFPYLRGSAGVLQDDGWFKSEDLGLFHPVRVMPLEDGLALQVALKALEGEYKVVLNSLHRGFKSRLLNFAPFAIDQKSTGTEVEPPAAEPPPAAGQSGVK